MGGSASPRVSGCADGGHRPRGIGRDDCPRRRRPEGPRPVHAGEHLLRSRAVRQGDRRLAERVPAQERSRLPLQHRAGLPHDGGRAEGDLLLQALPEQLAQGAQPIRGGAKDRGAAEAALGSGAGQGAPPARAVRSGQSGGQRHAARDRAAADRGQSGGGGHRRNGRRRLVGRARGRPTRAGSSRPGRSAPASRHRIGSICAPPSGSTPGRRVCRRTPSRRSPSRWPAGTPLAIRRRGCGSGWARCSATPSSRRPIRRTPSPPS